MVNNIVNIPINKAVLKSNDEITKILSKYTEKIINKDKTITFNEIITPYFLVNDTWNIDIFGEIEQFKDQFKNCKCINKHIMFSLNNKNINKEMKFIVYNKLFSNTWSLASTFGTQYSCIKRLNEFINKKYPTISSFKQLNFERTYIEWIDWLNNKNIKITKIDNTTSKLCGKNVISNTPIANFLKIIISSFEVLTDKREEWEKDRWDVRKLEQYGIRYNQTSNRHNIDFTKINNLIIRKDYKKYLKQRLITNNKFTWGSAVVNITYVAPFINYICKSNPTWNDLTRLERIDILKYIEWLTMYSKANSDKGSFSYKRYIQRALIQVQKFLSDIQIREYDIAPIKNIKTLILPEDKPKVPRYSNNQVNYISDYILEQLFDNINYLHENVVPVIYIMLKTGLRISDVLCLKQDCLIKLNNKFWIETDIEKTYIEGHRIPIDDELANMLAVLIDNTKKYSNKDNNPNNYIFVRYSGPRKGKPYSQKWIINTMNLFAIDYNITDELGNKYHFKNHAFRHTYAIKLLNGGADILTIQEILGHASPEMTMRYAKLLDDTKRKAFNKAVNQGIFSFDEYDKLKEENNGEIPSDIIDMLYTNHKLNALDTPYGTCMQRKSGKCNYAKQPPCLTCNNGSPCKDLCVGAFEGDIVKYEILINSTKNMIENAKMYNRTEMISENEELLRLYEDIYSKISQGSLIYSRLDKLKKKVD